MEGKLPQPTFNLNQLNSMFASHGLTQTDMIALSGEKKHNPILIFYYSTDINSRHTNNQPMEYIYLSLFLRFQFLCKMWVTTKMRKIRGTTVWLHTCGVWLHTCGIHCNVPTSWTFCFVCFLFPRGVTESNNTNHLGN